MRDLRVRWLVIAGMAIMGIALLTACDPPAPLLTLLVTSTTDARDAVPGDGVCEITVGAGDCSLRAAVDEANASATPVQVRVPPGTYPLTLPGTDDANAGGDLDVDSLSGDVVILASPPGAVIDATGANRAFDLRSGSVQLWGFDLSGASGPGVTVRFGAQAHIVVSTVHDNGTGVDVEPGANLTLHDATVARNAGAGVVNAGSLDATFTTVTANGAGGITATGSVTLAGSVVASQSAGADCTVAVTSSAYSADSDGSCTLSGTGDLPAATPDLGSLAATTSNLQVVSPQPGSVLIDTIPPGSGPCVADAVDEVGKPRPFGSACDIGAIEADFGLHLRVDNPIDVHDAAPGNGRCDIGDGTCTLRAAVDETNLRNVAGYPNSIDLDVDPTLSLTGANDDANATGDIDVTTPVNLSGGGHRIDAAGIDRVVDVLGDGVSIDLVTITGGHLTGGASGAGVRHTIGNLTIRRATIVDNSTDSTGAGDLWGGSRGGGVAAYGSLVEVDASTIARNGADWGGGIYHSRGIATITNSTLSDNVGGAYFTPDSFTTAPAQSASLTHVTVAGTTFRAGVSYPAAYSASATICHALGCVTYPGAPVTVTASLFANDVPNCGAVLSGGYNVGCTAGATDIAGPATLALLGTFGGPTPTRPSFVGGPGVDLVPPGTAGLCDGTFATDQRGVARPGGSGCDSGAIEGDNGTVLVSLAMSVDSPLDEHDADPNDGACSTSGGYCTLRAAVDQANAWPSADVITIGAGVDPTLSIAGVGDDTNATGDLDSTGTLTIDGNGNTIDGASLDRVLDNVIASSTLTISSIEIHDGNATGNGGAVRSAGPLDITSSVLHDNIATGAGGAVSGGLVTMADTTVEANVATSNGGGVRGSQLTLSGGIVRANQSGAYGGGLDAGGLTVTDTTIDNNAAQNGGGLAAHGGTGVGAVTRTTIHDNQATLGGGGAWIAGALDIVETTIESNDATLAGWGTGGGIQSTGTLNVTRSTIAGNTAVVRGGGLAADGGTIRFLNSTIDGNDGGTSGGAVSVSSASITFQMATVTGNRVTGGGYGAGVASPTSSYPAVYFAGTILNNAGWDCWGISAASFGYNVSRICEGLSSATDLGATTTPLAGLAANGGPTRTRMPFANNPGIDAIPAGTFAMCDTSVPTDQRNIARPSGAACDIGAVEGDNGLVPAPRTFTVDDPADAVDADPTDGVCNAGGGTCTLRAAIDEANAWPAADTVAISTGVNPTLSIAGAGEVGNATGDLDVFDALTIVGGGATIDAASLDRVLLVLQAAPLTLQDVTLTGGRVSGFTIYPGSTVSTLSPLHLLRTTVTGSWGGPAVATSEALTIDLVDSSVSDNATGGISAPNGSVVLTRSTVANDNTGVSAATVTATSSTITDSTYQGLVATTSASVTSTTLAGNGTGLAGSGTITIAGSVVDNDIDCNGPTVTSGGYNIVATPSCGPAAPSDLIGAALVAPLADNGGPTPTRMPFANSPAVDFIPVGTAGLCDGTTATDQRGIGRPVGTACDAGAVEGDTGTTISPLAMTVDTSVDAGDSAPGDGVCDTGVGACSLRAAIDESNASITADTITFAVGIDPVLSIPGTPGNAEDLNATGDLDITGPVTIDGTGGTVDGAALDRIFDVRAANVVIRSLTVRNGANGGDGGSAIHSIGGLLLDQVTVADSVGFMAGAVFIESGTTTIRNSTIAHNRGYGSGGSDHGGIAVWGNSVVTIEGSTISGNETSGHGGGIATASTPTVTITDSTISGNVSRGDGSAIDSRGGTITVVASTITQNAGVSSIYGPVTISASVVAPASGLGCDGGAVTSLDYNIVSDATCALSGANDVQSLDPLLGGLASNGGPTRTSLPYANSPLVDAIPAGTPSLCDGTVADDQRGVVRPAAGACDIGAVEGAAPTASVALALAVDSATDAVDISPGDGVCATSGAVCTLRAAIGEANARVGLDTIALAPGIHPTLSLAGIDDDSNVTGDLDITDAVTIGGPGNIISAAQLDRAFDLQASAVTMTDVTVRDGRLTTDNSFGGGFRISGGTLTLNDSTVRDNRLTGASSGGAGISAFSADVTVSSSTFTANQVGTFTGQGGALYELYSYVTFTNSTITSNAAFLGAGVSMWASTGIVTIDHTTISANAGFDTFDGSGFHTRASILVHSGTSAFCGGFGIVSDDWNVASDSSCGLARPNDQQNVAALLGPLAANGGPTLTLLPTLGSPAIDAIPAGTAVVCDGTLPTDQRGVARPQGAACDIGAVDQ